MGADHAAVFLAHDVQDRSVSALEAHHIAGKGAVQFDAQARGQVHAECVMGHQEDGIGRQCIYQQLADYFGIGVGQGLVVKFPDFIIGLGHGRANRIKIRSTACHDGGYRRISIN